MSTLEFVLNMLAEATTTEISKTSEPKSFDENRGVAIKGVGIVDVITDKNDDGK